MGKSEPPKPLHRQIKSRAELSGMSFSDYLLHETRQIAAPTTPDALLHRLARYPEAALSVSAAELLRAERDGR
jgi:hypothetical protein